MKKITTIFAVMVVTLMVTVSAFAGPIDWLMDKIGYTPTSSYELAKQEVAKATAAYEFQKIETLKANALVAKANANVTAANETIVAQSKTINYGGGVLVAALGGLAFLKRETIAKWFPKKNAQPKVAAA